MNLLSFPAEVLDQIIYHATEFSPDYGSRSPSQSARWNLQLQLVCKRFLPFARDHGHRTTEIFVGVRSVGAEGFNKTVRQLQSMNASMNPASLQQVRSFNYQSPFSSHEEDNTDEELEIEITVVQELMTLLTKMPKLRSLAVTLHVAYPELFELTLHPSTFPELISLHFDNYDTGDPIEILPLCRALALRPKLDVVSLREVDFAHSGKVDDYQARQEDLDLCLSGCSLSQTASDLLRNTLQSCNTTLRADQILGTEDSAEECEDAVRRVVSIITSGHLYVNILGEEMPSSFMRHFNSKASLRSLGVCGPSAMLQELTAHPPKSLRNLNIELDEVTTDHVAALSRLFSTAKLPHLVVFQLDWTDDLEVDAEIPSMPAWGTETARDLEVALEDLRVQLRTIGGTIIDEKKGCVRFLLL